MALQANYSVLGEGKLNTLTSPLSRAQSSQWNKDFEFTAANYMLNKEPDYYVYIYNLSEMNIGDGISFIISRPPIFSNFKVKAVTGETKKESGGKKYVLATRLPQPLLMPKGNVDSGEIDIVPTDTRRFAMDIINPDNWGTDQDAFIDNPSSVGNDLGKKGLFWSFNGPEALNYADKDGFIKVQGKKVKVYSEPQPEELKAAEVRLEKHYRRQLEEADAVAVSQPATLGLFLTGEHHAACDYFGEERNWHGRKSRAGSCPVCGDKMREGAAFHRTEDGIFCVNNWDGAIRAGIKTRAQAFEATGEEKYAPKGSPEPVAPAPVKPTTPAPSKEV